METTSRPHERMMLMIIAGVFIPLGVFVSLLPIRVRTDRCIACANPLTPGQAICPDCGAPQM